MFMRLSISFSFSSSVRFANKFSFGTAFAPGVKKKEMDQYQAIFIGLLPEAIRTKSDWNRPKSDEIQPNSTIYDQIQPNLTETVGFGRGSFWEDLLDTIWIFTNGEYSP